MLPDNTRFERSVLDQIARNRARTPDERLSALCELLDVARAMAPQGPDARQRRLRALAERHLQREQLRAERRRLLAARRPDAPAGL